MTHYPERDEPSYEGEVTDEPMRLRLRTWVALGALGIEGISLALGEYAISIGLIVAYVAWTFIRDWLGRRERDRSWNAVANNRMEYEEDEHW